MRSFSPFFSSRALVAAGTAALLLLIVVLITGGFVLDAGPLHFSARRALGPLLLAAAAWIAAALHGRARLAEASSWLSRLLDTHALLVAVVVSAAACGVGIAYGTYSASSADASGYVSQAALLSSARLVDDEPLARQVSWPNATWAFSPLGYRPGPQPGQLVPTYPPGLPLAMAAVGVVAGEEAAPYLVTPLLGALAAFCSYLLGARLHSRTAGVVAAALFATSPIVLFQIVQPMSDVPVTAWWALATVLALMPASGAVFAAGAATGLALLTRPNLLPIAIPVALVSAGWLAASHPASGSPGTSVRLRRLGLFALGAAPAIGVLLLVQWRLYGTPFTSGYGSLGELFAAASVWPNARAYALRLIAGEAPALLLGGVSLGVLLLSRAKSPTSNPRGIGPLTRLWLALVTAVLICYLPYAEFAEWSYLRFFLPAFPVTFVLIAALLTNALSRLPEAARGVAMLVLVVTACSANVMVASREQAFNLQRYEARYRTAGRYLDQALPRDAVVLAVQHSGSARYYLKVPIVRWDLLGVDLESALGTLRTLGRHPVFLVEDWEAADLRARFPASPTGRLDWQPRADIGDDIHVLLFDPADRERRGVITDRLH